ncbi:MAG: response regulator transcription factor [Xanthomonadales bacterium]|nr:LytTR family DNA-binding domain-containing protein [Gammaproteobacteria bacterium]MBT8054838.1 LytTR family DNA-binding domain-containing protein [Gammaproteobacteria bacterium]NND58519.1 response regulator transcription factor [Xanthomonadales bacterium]NNK51103.1 response regulator transcription factor [Xanthomonadales bacterium]
MLNILIIDDEKPARDRLHRLLDALPKYDVAGEAANSAQAIELIRQLNPDILLLDISMPGMDGMSLARVLQEGGASPAIIFCTAYQDQALNAFEVEAVDYLVKPVRGERLEKALNKAQRLLGQEKAPLEEHYVRSSVGGKVVLTPVHRVICLLSEDKYTTVVHEKGATVIDESLTELEQKYPGMFFRVHRNALVSRKHLRGLQRTSDGQTQVLLSGTDRKPEVSRRNISSLRKLLSEIS